MNTGRSQSLLENGEIYKAIIRAGDSQELKKQLGKVIKTKGI